MNKQFVGFGTSSEWLASIDKNLPVNVESFMYGQKMGKIGVRVVEQRIMLSQVVGNEVLYVYDTIGKYHSMDMQPMTPEDAHAPRIKSAFDLTCKWLEDNGVKFRRAMIATPKNLVLSEGMLDHIKWDRETDTYLPNYTVQKP